MLPPSPIEPGADTSTARELATLICDEPEVSTTTPPPFPPEPPPLARIRNCPYPLPRGTEEPAVKITDCWPVPPKALLTAFPVPLVAPEAVIRAFASTSTAERSTTMVPPSPSPSLGPLALMITRPLLSSNASGDAVKTVVSALTCTIPPAPFLPFASIKKLPMTLTDKPCLFVLEPKKPTFTR